MSRLTNEQHYSADNITFNSDDQTGLTSHDLSALRDSSVDTDLFRMIEGTEHQQSPSDLLPSLCSTSVVDSVNGQTFSTKLEHHMDTQGKVLNKSFFHFKFKLPFDTNFFFLFSFVDFFFISFLTNFNLFYLIYSLIIFNII